MAKAIGTFRRLHPSNLRCASAPFPKESRTSQAHLNAIGTAVPAHDVHEAFIGWAEARLSEPRSRALFARMAARSGIEHRWSVLPPAPYGASPVDPGGFYHGPLPTTGARMEIYAQAAPRLAMEAIGKLDGALAPGEVSHLIVASCTGFVAPGIDQIIARELGLGGHVERTLVGFMGCYAAVSALRLAHHIVRSEPAARVLVVTVGLSSLHLQYEEDVERLLAALQFGDGATASLVTAEPSGFALSRPFAATLPDSHRLIRWRVGDHGFVMDLSGEVPGRIGEALRDHRVREAMLGNEAPGAFDSWAVHAGGRSVLDAVEHGLELAPEALADSREILSRCGNMSSSTLPFVLERMLGDPDRQRGIALAFGPGLAAEGFHFERAA